MQLEIVTDKDADLNKEPVLGDIFYAGATGCVAMYQGLVGLQAQTA
ncbi:MAG: hypothetical protein Q9M28_04940 [Mariprofundaceae bacterium]|nr:hypothetical protein [Mariprofundaceae bacterium]